MKINSEYFPIISFYSPNTCIKDKMSVYRWVCAMLSRKIVMLHNTSECHRSFVQNLNYLNEIFMDGLMYASDVNAQIIFKLLNEYIR